MGRSITGGGWVTDGYRGTAIISRGRQIQNKGAFGKEAERLDWFGPTCSVRMFRTDKFTPVPLQSDAQPDPISL